MAGSNTRAFNESEIDQVDSPKLNNALLKLLSAQNQVFMTISTLCRVHFQMQTLLRLKWATTES